MNGMILLQIFFLGAGAYAAILLFYLVSRRPTQSISFLDVALAAALGTAIGATAVAGMRGFVAGVIGVALLLLLHYAALRRSRPWMRHVGGPEPLLLLYQGKFVPPAAEEVAAVRETVMTHLRTRGISSPSEVEALVLAPDGSVAIFRRAPSPLARPQGDASLN